MNDPSDPGKLPLPEPGERKRHPQDVLRGLPKERQLAIFEKLQAESAAAVKAWLAQDGLSVGTTALGKFYQYWARRLFLAEAEEQRQEMKERILTNNPEYTTAQAIEVSDAIYLATTGAGNFKGYVTLRSEIARSQLAREKIELAREKIGHDERKLKLLEAKAAKADALEASLKERKGKGGLTPETLELIESSLGMLK